MFSSNGYYKKHSKDMNCTELTLAIQTYVPDILLLSFVLLPGKLIY